LLCRLLPVAGALVAAAVVTSPAFAVEAPLEPVPSLTPAETATQWEQLADEPPVHPLAVACTPVRAVFYAGTDWLRLATKLAANASPCAQYYISVPPLAGNKTQFRGDQAWRIRALGPQFHALAEVNVTGWSSWVAANGKTWYEAGQQARRGMAAAGYDVSAGDKWVVNELSSAVRQGTGSARANMRSFIRGLYEGDGSVPQARGAVFVIGMSQATGELSVYQSRLQDWYEDAPFWNDMSAYVSDWSQEVYGDVRHWAVPGTAPATRATSLNEYLQHEIALARVAPASGAAATSFLSSAYNPLANAAWAYQEAFGWTDVQHDLMQSYVSSQVSAMRSYDGSRFGFAWAPKNLHTLAPADFNAQTGAILDRLAAAIAGADACAPSWCGGDLAGAAFNGGWQRFATWRPSVLAFTTAPQTITVGGASDPLTVEQRTSTGVAYTAGLPVSVTFASSSSGGSFSTSASGPWTPSLTAAIPSGADSVSVYYRDTRAGSPTITASAAGRVAATQGATVALPPDTTPPDTTMTLSSTHPSGWSNDRTVDVAWSGASDGGSGVDGYSYEWSQVASTTPDMAMDAEETATGTTSQALEDGEWWFHLRTRDNAGNWSGPVHLGPFRIDATAPGNPTPLTPSHAPDGWSNDPTVDVTWSGATDPHSGVDGFSYAWTQSATTTPSMAKNAEETATATASPALADGDWWFHLRTRDNAGNWSDAVHRGPFRIDTATPTNPTLSSPSHTLGAWSMEETAVVEWGTQPDADGYSYEWSQSAATAPDTVKDAEESTTSVASPRPDGSWWFHLSTLSDTGAWSHPAHVGPFLIDTTPPSSPAASSSSHTPGSQSTDRTVDVAWQGEDTPSGVAGYSLAWSPEPSTVPDTVTDTAETSTTSTELPDGAWWFHVRAQDRAGSWGAPAHLGPFHIETPLPPPQPQPAPEQPQPPPAQPQPPTPEPQAPQPLPAQPQPPTPEPQAPQPLPAQPQPPPAEPQPLPPLVLQPLPPLTQPSPRTSEGSSCVVPRLAGRTLKQSRMLLARDGCRLGRVIRVYSVRVPHGRVVVQRPGARARVARGARVNLTLSRGRPARSR
jgi:hypothetical protein